MRTRLQPFRGATRDDPRGAPASIPRSGAPCARRLAVPDFRGRLTAVVAAATSAAALVAASAIPSLPARADGTVPVPLGDVVYRGEILTDDRGPDTDEFGGRLLAGESLDVLLAAAGQSPIYPLLEVVGPDGVERDVRVVANLSGRRLAVRKFPVDATGDWTVRVSALAGTKGRYAVRFRVRRAPATTLSVPGGADPNDFPLPFVGLEGAQVRLRWTWKGALAPALESVADPSGAEVPVDVPGPASSGRAARKRRRAEAHVSSIAAGDGTYVARFTAPAGHQGFTASAEVFPSGRPRGRRTLTTAEPWIAPRASPLRVAAGLRVRIPGEGFSTDLRPRVFFGGVQGVEPFTDSFGTYVDVEVPPLPDGSLVPVRVVNSDGQAYERDGYSYYVPAPTVTGVVDVAGNPVAGGSTAGGLTIRLTGTNFQSGVIVRIGTGEAIVPQIRSPELIEVRTRPHPPGVVEVRVTDSYLHAISAPETFEFKDPPQFAATPLSPATADGSADTVVSVLGSGFQVDDRVLVDGLVVPTQYFTTTQLRFTLRAGPAAVLSIAVRDRVGTVVAGPTIERTAPP